MKGRSITIGIVFSILIQSLASVWIKMAGGAEWGTLAFFLYYTLALFFMGIYALMWQMLLEKKELSAIYFNKGLLYVFVLIWSWLIFKERMSVGQIAGICLILLGIGVSQSENV